jgi:hypothetical protein
MLARTAEWKMLVVRGALLAGWVGLIGSLFWDPISTDWTGSTGFLGTNTTEVAVQDGVLTNAPYQIGARVFWTMVVPLIPLCLMVFGHEAWRRVCPLSLMSQLPRYMGWQRRRMVLQRRTGKIDRTLALIVRGGWLDRNAWYLQFGILFVGLSARILFINSDRYALAGAMILVLSAAFLVGYLWGGKSWCNYFCPANIVQKIYTEPRGLLESAPHLLRPSVSQSMCRTSSPTEERSACVGCTVNCGDIDLEQSYWSSILKPQRRHVYYMFNGLIIGFYWYFYLYSGNWDYYFSGIWSHEAGALGRLLDPGLYIAGHSIPIPKILAVPLVIGGAVLATLVLGTMLERAYRLVRNRGTKIPEVEIVNHCLGVSAYLSINIFYQYGGRPTLALFPPVVSHIVDILVVSLSTMWLWQTLGRSAFKYEREKIASRLLDQLKKLKVDFSRYLEGRSIGELKPDEIYVLAKVLPDLSREHKLQAYRNLLDDAISADKTGAVSPAALLHDVRQQMGISDEDHLLMLEESGVAEASPDVKRAITIERMTCIANYHEIIGRYLVGHVASGRTLDMILADPGMQSTIKTLRISLQITDAEHRDVLTELVAEGGMLARQMNTLLNTLMKLQGVSFCLQDSILPNRFGRTLNELLLAANTDSIAALCEAGLSCLYAFGDSSLGQWYAQDLSALAGDSVIEALSRPVAGSQDVRWEDALGDGITGILRGQVSADAIDGSRPADMPRRSFRQTITAGLDRAGSLQSLLEDESPIIRALALAAFDYVDAPLTREVARQLSDSGAADDHWLLRQTVDILIGAVAAADAKPPEHAIRAEVVLPDGERIISMHSQSVITVGRGPGNDIVIASPVLWPYHMAIRSAPEEVRVMRLDDVEIFVDGIACAGESSAIQRDAVLTFGQPPDARPSIRIDWQEQAESHSLRSFDPAMRLVALARNTALRSLGLPALAEIIRDGQVGRYRAGDVLPSADDSGNAFFVQFGSVRALEPGAVGGLSARMFEAGDLIDPGIVSGGDGAPVLEIVSEFAIVMILRGDGAIATLMDTPPPTEVRAPQLIVT